MQEKVNNFHSVLTTKLNNMTSMEVNIYRNFISESMSTFAKLNQTTPLMTVPGNGIAGGGISSSTVQQQQVGTRGRRFSSSGYEEEEREREAANFDQDFEFEGGGGEANNFREQEAEAHDRDTFYNRGDDFSNRYNEDPTNDMDELPRQQLPTRKLRSRRG